MKKSFYEAVSKIYTYNRVNGSLEYKVHNVDDEYIQLNSTQETVFQRMYGMKHLDRVRFAICSEHFSYIHKGYKYIGRFTWNAQEEYWARPMHVGMCSEAVVQIFGVNGYDKDAPKSFRLFMKKFPRRKK